MERYPIEYTKKVAVDSLKVGDVIEPEWAWEPRLVVSAVLPDRVVFLSGEERRFSDWPEYARKVKLVKIRMSKTPEWFGK